MDFLLVFIELFLLGITAEAVRVIDWKVAFSKEVGPFWPNFHVAWLDKPVNALQACCQKFSHQETL